MVYMFKNGQFTNGTKVIRVGCGNTYEVSMMRSADVPRDCNMSSGPRGSLV
jgi:hypothetical protein